MFDENIFEAENFSLFHFFHFFFPFDEWMILKLTFLTLFNIN